jgi:hypothetical protein
VLLEIRVMATIGMDRREATEATADLAVGLRSVGIVASPATVGTPTGTRSGTALTLGSLVVQAALSGAAISAFAKVVIAFLHRGGDRKIVLKYGEDELEISGPYSKELRALVEEFLADREPPQPVSSEPKD